MRRGTPVISKVITTLKGFFFLSARLLFFEPFIGARIPPCKTVLLGPLCKNMGVLSFWVTYQFWNPSKLSYSPILSHTIRNGTERYTIVISWESEGTPPGNKALLKGY